MIFFWNCSYILDLLMAAVRGHFYRLVGLIVSETSKATFLMGSTHRSFFEKGARIILKSSETLPPENAPDDFNFHHASLGLLNPRKYQNPPEVLSRFRLLEHSRLELFAHTRVGPGFYISIGGHAVATIGSWTYIGSNFSLNVRSGVSIGASCMISHNVIFMDYDGHQIIYEGKDSNNISVEGANLGSAAPIVIGDNVWIGANVTILKGVHIGSGAVIASGTLVRKDVPSNSLVTGNPGEIVKESVRWKHF